MSRIVTARVRVGDRVLKKVVGDDLYVSFDNFSRALERTHTTNGRMIRDYDKMETSMKNRDWNAHGEGMSSSELLNLVKRYTSRCKQEGIDVRPLLLMVLKGYNFGRIEKELGLTRATVHNHLRAALAVWAKQVSERTQ